MWSSMQLHESIPTPLITGNELLCNVYYQDINYRVDDIFITETAVPRNPRQVLSQIGQKRKINLVMTGTVLNSVKVKETIINRQAKIGTEYDLRGDTVNFTFFNIRVNRNPDTELYIDNNCLFYRYFKMICVNKGLMDMDDERNISLPYDELRNICKGSIETLCKYRTMDGAVWRFKEKKGDTNGN